MRVIGDKNQISEDIFDFMISYLPFPQKSIRSELAKLFSISIYRNYLDIAQYQKWLTKRKHDLDVLDKHKIYKANFGQSEAESRSNIKTS